MEKEQWNKWHQVNLFFELNLEKVKMEITEEYFGEILGTTET